nr:MAG TPA: hypothetical protein [Caudoviricetes sp.]
MYFWTITCRMFLFFSCRLVAHAAKSFYEKGGQIRGNKCKL